MKCLLVVAISLFFTHSGFVMQLKLENGQVFTMSRISPCAVEAFMNDTRLGMDDLALRYLRMINATKVMIDEYNPLTDTYVAHVVTSIGKLRMIPSHAIVLGKRLGIPICVSEKLLRPQGIERAEVP